ncbi:MAG: SRPBCC domain-containing protein [Proteobacteria bacterium]|nr:SRPBCC domain-containing protein [Pseudomonadota bacterium]
MNIHAEKPKTQSLQLRHVFHVPAERLFDAWTDPSLVVQWFGPAGFTTPEAKIDLRVGGGYRFRMHPPHGEPFDHWGEYKIIDRPKTLAFTWILENQGCEGSKDTHCETLVTLEFIDMGDKTELIVTHDGLPTEKSREGHAYGWNSSLACLTEMIG